MPLLITKHEVKSILTRTSGFLRTVSSHSLQPYRGCTFGSSLCGVGCYVQHNYALTRGESWGSFLEVRTNAAATYLTQYQRELRWGRNKIGGFGIFMSSSTDPFLPQEDTFKLTHGLLNAMALKPPDFLIIQTHTHRVTKYLDLYQQLNSRCNLRFHISVESDRDRLPGLPPPANSVASRFRAAAGLRALGLRVIITVSPLLPIECPKRFFEDIAEVADGVIIDHFVEGDGSPNGSRTLRTALPESMHRVNPESVSIEYRDRMINIAQKIMPGRVGVSIDGFAGRFLPRPTKNPIKESLR